MRYEFTPANQIGTQASEFYLYVSHYKSGTSSADLTDRGEEAVIIRNDETNLPANARVIYSGDFNVTTSSEASYQTIAAADSPTGVAQGQGIDPLNTNAATGIDWGVNSLLYMKTESSTDLRYRDDFQMSTANIFNAVAPGLALVPGTYHVFGNNGTTAYESSVDNGTDTALNSDLKPGSPISASQLYADLIGASDHLPVVADYTIPVPPPAAAFTFSINTSGLPPLTVNFISASIYGIVTNWYWNFGDGATSNTSTTLSVAHTYTTAGVYSVTETVTGPGGSGACTATNLITVLTAFQAWQLQYFGCTACPQAQPAADADGTGQDNLFKYVAGLNPTNAASKFVFNIASVPNQPTWINLIFSPVVAGRTYTPQATTDLLNIPWAPLTTAAAPPVTNGVQVTLTDTNALQTRKFYQMEISMP
jgi:PKD repeat protein